MARAAKGDEVVKVLYERKPSYGAQSWVPVKSTDVDPDELLVKVLYKRSPDAGAQGWTAVPSIELDPEAAKVKVLYERKLAPGAPPYWQAIPSTEIDPDELKVKVLYQRTPGTTTQKQGWLSGWGIGKQENSQPAAPSAAPVAAAAQPAAQASPGSMPAPAAAATPRSAPAIVSAVVDKEEDADPLMVVPKRASSITPGASSMDGKVLVIGATGRLGREVVQKLVEDGRSVIVAARADKRASEVFGPIGLANNPAVTVIGGVDVTSESSLDNPKLWDGVSQVVSVLGPTAAGPADIESIGTKALAAAATKNLKRSTPDVRELYPVEDIAQWEVVTDKSVGGNSTGTLTLSKTDSMMNLLEGGAKSELRWTGTIGSEGGGFCTLRGPRKEIYMGKYDGLVIRVLGDGQTYKLNIKTADLASLPDAVYQTTFDTVAGRWLEVDIPWHSFAFVNKAKTQAGPPLNPSKIVQFSMSLSRFDFNSRPNINFKPGPYSLELRGGLSCFRDLRPQIVLLSSVGVERNVLLGDNTRERARSIPVVELNPGNMLNYLYEAEIAVRATGIPYAIARLPDIVEPAEDYAPRLLEADQGDAIAGSLTRAEAASVVAAALSWPEATNKTFEVRQCEAASAKGITMGEEEWLQLFMALTADRNRWKMGMTPFPKPLPHPEPSVSLADRAAALDEALKRSIRKAKFLSGKAAEPTEEEGFDRAEEEVLALRRQLEEYSMRISRQDEELLGLRSLLEKSEAGIPLGEATPATVTSSREIPVAGAAAASAVAPVAVDNARLKALEAEVKAAVQAETLLRAELDSMADELTSMSEVLMEQASAMAASASEASAATEALRAQLNAAVARLVESETLSQAALSRQKAAEASLAAARVGFEAETNALRASLADREVEIAKLRASAAELAVR